MWTSSLRIQIRSYTERPYRASVPNEPCHPRTFATPPTAQLPVLRKILSRVTTGTHIGEAPRVTRPLVGAIPQDPPGEDSRSPPLYGDAAERLSPESEALAEGTAWHVPQAIASSAIGFDAIGYSDRRLLSLGCRPRPNRRRRSEGHRRRSLSRAAAWRCVVHALCSPPTVATSGREPTACRPIRALARRLLALRRS